MNFSTIVFILFLVVYFGHWGFVSIILGTCSLCVSTPVVGQCYINIHGSMLACVHVYTSPQQFHHNMHSKGHNGCHSRSTNMLHYFIISWTEYWTAMTTAASGLPPRYAPWQHFINLILVSPIRCSLRPVNMQLVYAGMSVVCIKGM
jgi:hypothetical protein